MGLSSQRDMTWKSIPVTFDIAVFLIEAVHRKRVEDGFTERQRPKVAIDASLIGYKFVCDRASVKPIQGIKSIATELVEKSIDVIIQFDGEKRHHSKRAYCQRRTDKDKAHLQRLELRTRLVPLLHELNPTEETEKEKKAISAKLRSLEAQTSRSLPDNFVSVLKEFQQLYDSKGKGVISVGHAPWQADPCIAKAAIDGDIDAILSGDSDFSMYVGPSGPSGLGDFMLRNPVINGRTLKVEKMELQTGQSHVANFATTILKPKLGNVDLWKSVPKYPLFDKLRDPFVRAVLAVAVGSDVNPGGIPGFGAAAAMKLLQTMTKENGEVDDDLLRKLCEHGKKQLEKSIQKNRNISRIVDADSLHCLADSLMFETTYHTSAYMHREPATLDRYNQEFASGNTTVVDGPLITTCKGSFSCAEHPFLAAEGITTCTICKATLCRFCHWEEPTVDTTSTKANGDDAQAADRQNNKENCNENGAQAVNSTIKAPQYCMECKSNMFADLPCELTEAEMRQYLGHQEAPVYLPASSTYAEVWQTYLLYSEKATSAYAERIDNVKYPLHPPRVLHPSVLETENSEIKIIHRAVPMRAFPGVIGEPLVSDKAKAGLIHFMAMLTRTSRTREKGETLTYHHCVGDNLIQMAQEARVHKGGRMIERAVRHTMDPATPDIITAKEVMLAEFHGATCIIIGGHEVMPSMRTSLKYKVQSAITATDFVACQCQCQVSCRNKSAAELGDEKVLCTHALTPWIQLSMLLYEGLAEQLLLELRNWMSIDNDLEMAISERQRAVFRKDVMDLLIFAGQSIASLDEKAPIFSWLETLAVSTDLSKRDPGRPNPNDVGLLREKCVFRRPVSKLAAIREKAILNAESASRDALDDAGSMEESTQNAPKPPEPKGTLDEQYKQSQLLVDAISLVFKSPQLKHLVAKSPPSDARPIGFELLFHRAKASFDLDQRMSVAEPLAGQLKEALLHYTQKRSKPYAFPQSTTTMKAAGTAPPTVETTPGQGLRLPAMATPAVNTVPPVLAVTNSAAGVMTNTTSSSRKRKRCKVDWCRIHVGPGENISVPNFPPDIFSDEAMVPSSARQKTYAKRRFIRREWTERLSLTRNCSDKDMVICKNHPMEMVTGKSTTYNEVAKDGTQMRINLAITPFCAPVQVGKKSFTQPASTLSKGKGTDRLTLRELDDVATNDASSLAHWQTVEMNDIDNNQHKLSDILPLILQRSGLDVHIPQGSCTRISKPTSDDAATTPAESNLPKVGLHNLTPKEVHRRTGFSDLKELLSFAATICAGDLQILTQTVTKLTWVEEWVLYGEFVYGRVSIRWEDFAATWESSRIPIRRAICFKIALVHACRERWPMYASYAEDAQFRKEKWNEEFGGRRPVFHDCTNIPLFTASDADLQRALWNEYYAQSCAKAGISNQLCAWIRGMALCTGRICDSGHVNATGILKKQEKFVKEDKSSKEPFLNVFDKGFRLTLAAMMQGQQCLQPAFAKSDRQFGRGDALHTACVAVQRSGNERAVMRSKMSWFIKRGITDQSWSVDMLCDVWEVWTFQVNFMYDKYL